MPIDFEQEAQLPSLAIVQLCLKALENSGLIAPMSLGKATKKAQKVADELASKLLRHVLRSVYARGLEDGRAGLPVDPEADARIDEWLRTRKAPEASE